MRSQDRSRTLVAKAERRANGGRNPAQSFAKSEYDTLYCRSEPLEDGSWRVCLVRAKDYMASLEIVDRETGERVDIYGVLPTRTATTANVPHPLEGKRIEELNLDDLDSWEGKDA
jgi:hypothetical protein